MEDVWERGIGKVEPNLPNHWVQDCSQELTYHVGWSAHVFVKLADSPQETFGATSIEATAAELPYIVSDWDAYHDTVVQANESPKGCEFRMTARIIEGLGHEESTCMLIGSLCYEQIDGLLAKGIAVDLQKFKQRLVDLLDSPILQHQIGIVGQRKIESIIEYSVATEKLAGLLKKRTFSKKARKFPDLNSESLQSWLTNYSKEFAPYPTKILPSNWQPKELPAEDLGKECASRFFQKWGANLLKSDTTRRKGWCLKQELVQP